MNSLTKISTGLLCFLLLTCAACASRPAGDSSSSSSSSGSAAGAGAPPSSGGTAAAPGAAAISESDKPLDVLTRALRAQLDAKSYRGSITTTLVDGATIMMLIEYVAPDSFRMIQMGRGGAGGDSEMEFVFFRGAVYVKMPNGQWAKSPIDASAIIKSFRDPKMLDELAKSADVKFIGPDTFDGAPMLVYQYTQNNPLGMNLKNTSKTWLSVADGLPRKTESEAEFEGRKTKTLVIMSDYNADIEIESPVK